jgi:sugar phosphate permease
MKPIHSNKPANSAALFTLIIAGETIFFLPFLLARIFRPTMLEVYDISNVELGTYFSTYGIVAMISYIFGGPFADRYPARKLMAIALWLTALGGFAASTLPGGFIMRIISGFWGFTTIFLFWSAMIRATREWGGNSFQGRAYGWLEGGRGAVAATLGIVSWLLFIKFTNETSIYKTENTGLHPFQLVIIVISIITSIVGLLVWYKVPDNTKTLGRQSAKELYIATRKIIGMPGIWLLALIIVCAYSGYKITDDFSLYAREVLGYSETSAAGIASAALWLRAIVAIAIGFFADRYSKINIMLFLFGLTIISGILIWTGFIQQTYSLIFINLALLAIGIYGVRALYFAIQKEASVPLAYTGTAIGIISFVGYTPDVFMSPWMGYLLDSDPGVVGHQHVFLLLSGFTIIGFTGTLLLKKIH